MDHNEFGVLGDPPSAGVRSKPTDKTPSRRKQPSHAQLTSTCTFDNLEHNGAGVLDDSPDNDGHYLESEMPLPPGVSRVLRDLTSTMNTVLKRMDTMETTIKNRISSISSSSESGSGSKKKTRTSIPLLVRLQIQCGLTLV